MTGITVLQVSVLALSLMTAGFPNLVRSPTADDFIPVALKDANEIACYGTDMKAEAVLSLSAEDTEFPVTMTADVSSLLDNESGVRYGKLTRTADIQGQTDSASYEFWSDEDGYYSDEDGINWKKGKGFPVLNAWSFDDLGFFENLDWSFAETDGKAYLTGKIKGKDLYPMLKESLTYTGDIRDSRTLADADFDVKYEYSVRTDRFWVFTHKVCTPVSAKVTRSEPIAVRDGDDGTKIVLDSFEAELKFDGIKDRILTVPEDVKTGSVNKSTEGEENFDG